MSAAHIRVAVKRADAICTVDGEGSISGERGGERERKMIRNRSLSIPGNETGSVRDGNALNKEKKSVVKSC